VSNGTFDHSSRTPLEYHAPNFLVVKDQNPHARLITVSEQKASQMTNSTTLDISSSFTHAPSDAAPWAPATADDIQRLPFGDQIFWGVPFALSESGLVVAGEGGVSNFISIRVDQPANYLVFAHFCDSKATKTTPVGDFSDPQTADYAQPVVTAPGEDLGTYVIVYEDGTEISHPIRRRFEVNQVASRMQSAFSARPHQGMMALDPRGPYPKNQWGRMQTAVNVGDFGPLEQVQAVDQGVSPASWSIFALPNPHKEKNVQSLRVAPSGAAAIGIGGITAFTGASHPLRLNQLETIEVTSQAPGFEAASAEVSVDQGVVARSRPSNPFSPGAWMADPVKGWGEHIDLEHSGDSLIVDLSATSDASLSVDGSEIPAGDLYESGQATSVDGKMHARVLTEKREWISVKIKADDLSGTTPARVHFRSDDGRYFPPYGHRHEVNDNWFEDYGADLKLGSTNYAYVDGEFPIELPTGKVYAEISKGFEYEPQRIELDIKPGQTELDIEFSRMTNLRQDGWITADSHTHFISPDTAWLEAQAEGLNIINLLAAQWGDLFTNVGDITGQAGFASRDETVVWVGSENRQHFLGHISMLGTQGAPIFPMSTSGPTEGYFGDPTWRAMSEWADECRATGGVVVVPHFPFPYSEVVAEVVRGRVDGLELRDFWAPTMDTFAIHEWYRLLNTGYRVSAIGGTDKMSAGMPVGGVRTYANIGDDEFSFDAWGRAVRAGRTYTTSGPLMSLSVEGSQPGDEISLNGKSGKLQVEASAIGTMPFHKLEVVLNGKVVAESSAAEGTTSLSISEQISVDGSGWIAARAVSEHKAQHIWPVHFNAHTSPVYLKAKGSELFDNPTAEYLITVMEGGMTWLDTLATPAPPARHAAVKSVFEEAIEGLRERLSGNHSHPASHHGHNDHSHPPTH